MSETKNDAAAAAAAEAKGDNEDEPFSLENNDCRM